jgi:hypothetical protein
LGTSEPQPFVSGELELGEANEIKVLARHTTLLSVRLPEDWSAALLERDLLGERIEFQMAFSMQTCAGDDLTRQSLKFFKFVQCEAVSPMWACVDMVALCTSAAPFFVDLNIRFCEFATQVRFGPFLVIDTKKFEVQAEQVHEAQKKTARQRMRDLCNIGNVVDASFSRKHHIPKREPAESEQACKRRQREEPDAVAWDTSNNIQNSPSAKEQPVDHQPLQQEPAIQLISDVTLDQLVFSDQLDMPFDIASVKSQLDTPLDMPVTTCHFEAAISQPLPDNVPLLSDQ